MPGAGAQAAGRDGDLGLQDQLNAALRHGASGGGAALARHRDRGAHRGPARARPAELAAALRAATARWAAPAFVPDAACVGTTLYAVPPGGEFLPSFGGASRARHASSGAAELDLDDMAGLRRDVDTPDDLRSRARPRHRTAHGRPRRAKLLADA